MVSVYTIKS